MWSEVEHLLNLSIPIFLENPNLLPVEYGLVCEIVQVLLTFATIVELLLFHTTIDKKMVQSEFLQKYFFFNIELIIDRHCP